MNKNPYVDSTIYGERELFEQVLAKIMVRYNLTQKHPHNDEYFELYKGDKKLGGMNPAGWSLLYNITQLSEICKNFN